MMVSHARFFWPVIALCALMAAAVLWAMPAEKSIGDVIKLVYLHGALSRAGMIGFWLAGLAGAAYLAMRRPSLVCWCEGLLWSAWGFWVAHFVVSMPATRLTWGPWIAWGEPRVTMTLQIAAVGLISIVIARLLHDARFTALTALLLAVAVAFLAAQTGVLRHPLDPIGASPSNTLRLIYGLLLVPVIGSMALVAWRLARCPGVSPRRFDA